MNSCLDEAEFPLYRRCKGCNSQQVIKSCRLALRTGSYSSSTLRAGPIDSPVFRCARALDIRAVSCLWYCQFLRQNESFGADKCFQTELSGRFNGHVCHSNIMQPVTDETRIDRKGEKPARYEIWLPTRTLVTIISNRFTIAQASQARNGSRTLRRRRKLHPPSQFRRVPRLHIENTKKQTMQSRRVLVPNLTVL
jgi:hypothetical protein